MAGIAAGVAVTAAVVAGCCVGAAFVVAVVATIVAGEAAIAFGLPIIVAVHVAGAASLSRFSPVSGVAVIVGGVAGLVTIFVRPCCCCRWSRGWHRHVLYVVAVIVAL